MVWPCCYIVRIRCVLCACLWVCTHRTERRLHLADNKPEPDGVEVQCLQCVRIMQQRGVNGATWLHVQAQNQGTNRTPWVSICRKCGAVGVCTVKKAEMLKNVPFTLARNDNIASAQMYQGWGQCMKLCTPLKAENRGLTQTWCSAL